MEHLDEKYRQIHCKTKLFNPSESQNKKSNFYCFFDIFVLVRDFRQFKNKLQRRLKMTLLFFFV